MKRCYNFFTFTHKNLKELISVIRNGICGLYQVFSNWSLLRRSADFWGLSLPISINLFVIIIIVLISSLFSLSSFSSPLLPFSHLMENNCSRWEENVMVLGSSFSRGFPEHREIIVNMCNYLLLSSPFTTLLAHFGHHPPMLLLLLDNWGKKLQNVCNFMAVKWE